MKVLNIDEVEGRKITTPGNTRTLKDLISTKNMTTHVGIIPPGQASSKHVHMNSEEVCCIIKGEGAVTAGGETKRYGPNYLVYIPLGVYHQYTSDGNEDLILFCVYSPPAEVPKK